MQSSDFTEGVLCAGNLGHHSVQCKIMFSKRRQEVTLQGRGFVFDSWRSACCCETHGTRSPTNTAVTTANWSLYCTSPHGLSVLHQYLIYSWMSPQPGYPSSGWLETKTPPNDCHTQSWVVWASPELEGLQQPKGLKLNQWCLGSWLHREIYDGLVTAACQWKYRF